MTSSESHPSKSSFQIQILDGGLGTTLQALDPAPRIDPSLWSSTPLVLAPDVLSTVHTSFLDAGADIVSTATYQATLGAVCWMDIHDAVDGIICKSRAERIMRSAVSLARDAVDQKGNGSVALSLGPYGSTMRPSTEYNACYDSHHSTQASLRKWHLDRLMVYASDPETWAKIDYIAFETFGRTDEILAARKALDDLITTECVEPKKFWISCVFVEIDGQIALPSGETAKKALHALLSPVTRQDNTILPRPWGIGVNCTKVSRLGGIIQEWEREMGQILSPSVEWPAMVLYPDGTKKNERYDTTRQEWVMEGNSADESETWEKRVAAVVKGVSESVGKTTSRWKGAVVGGCCRTGPKEIGGLRYELFERCN